MPIHKAQRIGIFVDVSNMYYSAKNLFGSKVDFGKVLISAVADRNLIRAFAYVVRADVGAENEFFDALEKRGFEVRAKDLQIFYGGAKKGDWDVGMSMDAIKLADKVDVVVLITGDGDFAPLVDYLKNNKGCRVEVMGFGRTTSAHLIEVADSFTDLEKISRTILIGDK